MRLQKISLFNKKDLYILNNTHINCENIEKITPYRDGVVMKGRDLVEYYNIETYSKNNCLIPVSENRDELKNKLLGNKENRIILLNKGGLYTFYFKNEKNKNLFINSPEKFLPGLGGYCLWGLAYEWNKSNECDNAPQCNDNGIGWTWTKYIMGPPADLEFGWFIYKTKLYFNFASYYRDKAIEDIKLSVEIAHKRWKFYYENDIGPLNVRSWGAPEPQYRQSLTIDKNEYKKLLNRNLRFCIELINYYNKDKELIKKIELLVKDLSQKGLIM